jgi:hypothetical protein
MHRDHQPLPLLVARPDGGHQVEMESGSWFADFPLGDNLQ